MTSIFLSYARGDDGEPFDPATSFVARLHRGLTAAGFEVWFDRVSMPSRALTFHQEIRDAVAACDRLVLVVGPKAKDSLYVQQEWQFAYFWDSDGAAKVQKIVTPILRLGDLSYLPDELKLLDCEDFRDDGQYERQLQKLIRQLTDPAPALGKLIGVPSLPPHFLSRTDRLTALRDALRADLDRPVVITGAAARVGMHGMGGIGKSVLAATLSRDRKIREAFPDGIVWVGLGPLPTVADLQRRVHKDLGGDGAFQTEHEGRVKLRDILNDKGVLLILDDVWRRADVDWFDVLGPRCRAMITTRDAGLLTSLGGVHHQVELLSDAEALNLLAQAAGVERDKLPGEADDLIAECGRLPLAVALCGGLIRHGFAWAKVLEQLRTSRIDRIKDPHAAKVEHENIWNAIDVSVKFLSTDEQARFLELAVFPPHETTPIAAIGTLWSHTAGFDDWDTDALVIKLSQRSLLELTTSADGKAISLHALVYDYVHRAAGDETASHQRLLEAYCRKCPHGWYVDPPNDGYFFTHLRHHLIEAGRVGELADLLHELRWLEAKNEAGVAFDLPADFQCAQEALDADDVRPDTLRLLSEALHRDLPFIHRHRQDYPQALFQCMWNIAWWFDCPHSKHHYRQLASRSMFLGSEQHGLPDTEPAQRSSPRLHELLARWRQERANRLGAFHWLRSVRPPVIPLDRGLVKAFEFGESINAVAFSPDGELVAAGGPEGVRIWRIEADEEVASIGSIHLSHFYFCKLRFAPDQRSLITIGMASTDPHTPKVIAVWDWDRQIVSCLDLDGAVIAGDIAESGTVAVSIKRGDSLWIEIWHCISKQKLAAFRPTFSRCTDMLLLPKWDRLVCVGNQSTWVIDHPASSPGGPEFRELDDVMIWHFGLTASACSQTIGVVLGRPKAILRLDAQSLAYKVDVDIEKDGALLKTHSEICGMAFATIRGDVFAMTRDGMGYQWSLETHKTIATWVADPGDGRCLALAVSERMLATGGRGGILRLWDTSRICQGVMLQGHDALPPPSFDTSGGYRPNQISLLGFSRNGEVLYSVDGQRGYGQGSKAILVWDAADGRLLRSIEEGDPLEDIWSGPKPGVHQAVSVGIETSITRPDTNGIVAYYPALLDCNHPHPFLPRWAATDGSQVLLVSLEEECPAPDGA